MEWLQCHQFPVYVSFPDSESHFSETKNKFIPQNYLHDKSFNKYTLDGNNRRMNTVRDYRTLELVLRVLDGHGLWISIKNIFCMLNLRLTTIIYQREKH